ncbi:isochorismatase family cysteine hydrolase [Martelella sp. HB161492]|uniref:isochorismatase family protein n=1 Tax=Martelella sp. HB161492 TaxID=2720726 RepID=UPI00159025E4
MSISPLDRDCGLIVIDLQKGIVSMPTVHPISAVVDNVVALVTAFRTLDLPVVLVNVAGGPSGRTELPRPLREVPDDWAELIPDLNRQAGDHLVTKMTPGAFTHTDLEAHLRSAGVTQVVIAGVSTSNGVEMTARQAHELGFHVALATDAMTDMREDAHRWSTERVFPRIGETATTQDILDCLETRSACA